MKGFYGVFWREMIILKRRIFKTLASYAVSPLLFLIAFGWGMGKSIKVEGIEYLKFMIPGLIALSSMSQSFSISTEINIARFYWMTFEELQTAPISSLAITLGEVLAAVVRGMLACFVILFLAFFFGVKLNINLAFIMSVFLNTFIFGCAAVVTSMLVKSHADQASFNSFFIVPMSFLCGTFFSLKKLPSWAYMLTQVLPLTHASLSIRAAALGKSLPKLSFCIMIIYSFFFFIWAVVCVKRASV